MPVGAHTAMRDQEDFPELRKALLAVEDVEACVGPLRYGVAPSSIPKRCGNAYARLDACMERHAAQ